MKPLPQLLIVCLALAALSACVPIDYYRDGGYYGHGRSSHGYHHGHSSHGSHRRDGSRDNYHRSHRRY